MIISAPESEGEKVVGIPGFWLQCLQNHPSIGDMIADEDTPALECLKDIRCEYNDDMSGFKLIFVFGENEFFANTVWFGIRIGTYMMLTNSLICQELSKSYTVSPDLLDEKAPALTAVEGTTIEWKPKKNLCIAEIRKKQRAKGGKKAGQVGLLSDCR